MTARRFLRFVLLFAVALFGPGCMAVVPNRLMVIYEHDAAAETGTPHKERTGTAKVGVTGVYDLH